MRMTDEVWFHADDWFHADNGWAPIRRCSNPKVDHAIHECWKSQIQTNNKKGTTIIFTFVSKVVVLHKTEKNQSLETQDSRPGPRLGPKTLDQDQDQKTFLFQQIFQKKILFQ